MKFPSIKILADSAVKTVKRFPFEILFALAGTIASCIRIELKDIDTVPENWCLRVMIIANLGFLLNLSATLYAESKPLSAKNKFWLRIVATVFALQLLFIINPRIRQADYVRYFLLSLGLHLLVAFAAFTNSGTIQAFWQFNKTLFLRFLTAFLYSIVLFLGISAAISATNYLFNFKFEWDTFSILFTWIIGIFSTTFFLAGVPADFILLNDDYTYPKGLKVFTQYVLIPLSSIYVLILLAYEIKILVQWNLPKGAVSYLILSYAVFGILSLLLVYPVRNREENKWLKTYTRSFYFLLLPLLVLLFIAVWVRFSEYGVTEFRYFLIVLACWLLFITVYFLFFKKQNIKIIPVSLCIVVLLSVYGPQSAFSVSMYSQRGILADILKRNHAIRNGKFIPIKKISDNDGAQVAEILKYLVDHHDITSLQPYFNKDLNFVSDSLRKQKKVTDDGYSMGSYELREEKLDWVENYLALNDTTSAQLHPFIVRKDTSISQMYFLNRKEDIIDINGFNFLLQAKGYNDTTHEVLKGIKFTESKDSYKNYTLTINNEKVAFDLEIFAKKLMLSKNKFIPDIDANSNKSFVADDLLNIKNESTHYIVILKINSINLNYSKNGNVDITYADADYLIKVKP